MKKYLINIISVLFLLAALPPAGVRAAGRDGFRVDEKGTVTVVSQHAAGEGISSLGFSLNVEPEQAASVGFQFEGSSAEVLEYRYDKETQKLNVYIAGTEALFAEGAEALTIGRVTVQDESGGEAAAKVSVVEGSLQYVYGTEARIMQGIDLPGTVQIGTAGTSRPPVQTPQPTQAPAQTPQPTQAPVQTPQPAQTPQPTQAPVQTSQPTQAPPAQDQEDPPGQEGQTSQPPSATRTPAPIQAQRPSAQLPGATQRPRPTSVPVRPLTAGEVLESALSKTFEIGIRDFAGKPPAGTPDQEDGYIFSRPSDDAAPNREAGSGGWNALLVIAIIVIVVVVAVEIAAFIVVKKKPKK